MEAIAATLSMLDSPQKPFRSSPSNPVGISIGPLPISVLVETGATVSALRSDIVRKLRKVTAPISGYLLCTTGKKVAIAMATCAARVGVRAAHRIIEVIASPSFSHPGIPAWDFLSTTDAVIDCRRFLLELFATIGLVPVHPSSLKLNCEENTGLPPCVSAYL